MCSAARACGETASWVAAIVESRKWRNHHCWWCEKSSTKEIVYISTRGESEMKETFDNAPFTVPLFVHLTAKCRIGPIDSYSIGNPPISSRVDRASKLGGEVLCGQSSLYQGDVRLFHSTTGTSTSSRARIQCHQCRGFNSGKSREDLEQCLCTLCKSSE